MKTWSLAGGDRTQLPAHGSNSCRAAFFKGKIPQPRRNSELGGAKPGKLPEGGEYQGLCKETTGVKSDREEQAGDGRCRPELRF